MKSINTDNKNKKDNKITKKQYELSKRRALLRK